MTDGTFTRLKLLVGDQAFQRLQHARVLLMGVGGVGSWTAEALVRSGIGNLTIVDFDTVKESNVNRQLLALHSTLGQAKVTVMGQRLLDINPDLNLEAESLRLTEENVPQLLDRHVWDYVVDAIDERPPKIAAMVHCLNHRIPIVSSMGAANKLSTQGIDVVDISQTTGCHLARIIRKTLRKHGIVQGLKVVCSPEIPQDAAASTPEAPGEKRPLGTIVFLPASFGLKCAEVVIHSILDRSCPPAGVTRQKSPSSPQHT